MSVWFCVCVELTDVFNCSLFIYVVLICDFVIKIVVFYCVFIFDLRSTGYVFKNIFLMYRKKIQCTY